MAATRTIMGIARAIQSPILNELRNSADRRRERRVVAPMRLWLLVLVGACAPAAGNVRHDEPRQSQPAAGATTKVAPRSGTTFGFWLVADETWHSTLYWLA